MGNAKGDVGYQQLTAALAHTGGPREILSDGGSDLQAGIAQFQQTHPATQAIYDLKHKTALVLKPELADDSLWNAFTRQAAQTKQRVQQTALAFLAPPAQRRTARYMNVDRLIRWGPQVLAYLAQSHPTGKTPVTAAQLRAVYGWLHEFREPLQDWAEILHIVETTEQGVRSQGLSAGAAQTLTPLVTPLLRTARGQRVAQHLLTFGEPEAAKAAPHERVLGSSEVIESVFGKRKRLEQQQARRGFTGLVLAVGALVAPPPSSDPTGAGDRNDSTGSAVVPATLRSFRTGPTTPSLPSAQTRGRNPAPLSTSGLKRLFIMPERPRRGREEGRREVDGDQRLRIGNESRGRTDFFS